MARAIVPHLRSAGYRLRLYNRTSRQLQGLLTEDTVLCSTPMQAASGADVVISLVSDDAAGSAVWFGDDGALTALRAGALAVECSTLSAAHTRRWIAKCQEREIRPVDMPVTGSLPRAELGTLIGFAGGAVEDLHRLGPVFSTFTETVIPFGPVGAGMRYKLVHNLAAAATLVGLAEALSLAEAGELDMQQVAETLAAYGWAAPVAQSKAQAMIAGSHDEVMCSLANLEKDVRYALRAAGSSIDLPLARVMSTQFKIAAARGAAQLDMAAVKFAYGTAQDEELLTGGV